MSRALILLSLPLVNACAAQVAGDAPFLSQAGPASEYRVPVVSWEERRFAGVVQQKFDFSCGSAALATLLRHHYGYEVREDNAFRGMWAAGDRAQIRQVGFSLLDMKRWLATRGLAADGYKVSLDDIQKTGIPGLALIMVENYRHFVVVKGVRGNEVLVGDPSRGLTVMSRGAFLAAWNGVYFVLSGEQAIGRDAFGRAEQWAAFTRAPVGNRFSDPVSQQALMLSAPFYGDIG